MKEILNLGNVVDDGNGDYLREGGSKIRNNFNDLYSVLGDGNNPFPAGAWKTVKSSTSNILNVAFGQSYALDTATAKMQVKLPKGTSADYNKVIRLRDTFGTWQRNPVTVVPATGDTLKGRTQSMTFTANLTDLEMVYCSPGRWEFLANKQINKLTSDEVSTVMKQEFICAEGQTDFIDVFDTVMYNPSNLYIYHRGNLLYFGDSFSVNSDYGSPGAGNAIVDLDSKSIRLRHPASEGDSLVVVTYLDGIASWRSTYNRLDTKVLDVTETNETSVVGSVYVGDLSSPLELTIEELGYTLSSNSGLINPNTLEVMLNGVVLNEAGKAGVPLFVCSGADADSELDCGRLGGTWDTAYDDYRPIITEGVVTSIRFGTKFESGDIITLKWFNNNIGTTMEIDDIVEETNKLYITRDENIELTGEIRVTDFTNPAWPNVELLPAREVSVDTPSDVFDRIYPVGTIYENGINPNNPATYMGYGTWILWGEKRFTVGWTDDVQDGQFNLNNNDLDSNGNPRANAGGTGGSRTNTITNDNLPTTETDEKVLIKDANGTVIIGGCQFDPDDTGPAYDKYREEQAKTNAGRAPAAINGLPPYITLYRWMRIL